MVRPTAEKKYDPEDGDCKIYLTPGAYSYLQIAEIKKRFQAAGWNVKHESGSDHRDGDWEYLIFS